MATPIVIAKVSSMFEDAFGKSIEENAYKTWLTIFQDIDDGDLVKAAWYLCSTREKTNKVSPGEMRGALERIGVSMPGYEETKEFKDNPAVKMLNSRYCGECEANGITMHDWLQREGMASFKDAMARFADPEEVEF